MGKATVISKNVSDNTLTVRIEKDNSNLLTRKTGLTSIIAALTTKVNNQQIKVNSAQLAADNAKIALDTAVSNQEPREILVKAQNTYIEAVNTLVGQKTILSTLSYQKLSSEKELEKVDAEIADWPLQVIPMADSGTSIQVNDIIGVAEYSRLSNKDSYYVALPSEREGHSYLYNSSRDGIALPKLAEDPYGWWYNTMVIPSAQIHRPRYWIAALLSKNDGANTGVIYIYPSDDFNVLPVPYHNALWRDVTFDYETTDSLTFTIGSDVLVEFNGTTPTIIGFADKLRIEADKTSRYRTIDDKEVFGNPGPRLLINLANAYPGSLQVYDPAIRSSPVVGSGATSGHWSASKFLAEQDALVHGPIYDYYYGIYANPPFSGIYIIDEPRTPPVFDEFRPKAFVISFTSSNFIYQTSVIAPGEYLTSNKRVIGRGEVSRSYEVRSTPNDVHLVSFGRDSKIRTLPSDFDVSGTTSFSVEKVIGTRSGGDDEFTKIDPIGSYDIDQSSSTEEDIGSNPNLFTKWKELSDGVFSTRDWLIHEDFWLFSPNGGIILEYIEPKNYIDDTGFTGTEVLEAGVILRVGIPDFSDPCISIATDGTQNYVSWSESFSHNNGTNNLTISEESLKSPTCTDDEAALLIIGLGDADASLRLAVDGVISGNTYTYSIYVRRNSFPYVWLFPRQGPTLSDYIMEFDLVRGFARDTDFPAAGLIDYGITAESNEWYRIWVVFEATANDPDLEIYLSNRGNELGLSGIGAFGAQANDGTSPTNYLKTTGTAVP